MMNLNTNTPDCLFFCYILKDKIVGSPQNLDNSIFSYITRQSFFFNERYLMEDKTINYTKSVELSTAIKPTIYVTT